MKLSPHWSFNILNDPKRLAFVLSRYKFAGTIFNCKYNYSVLELGCSEGIGIPFLLNNSSNYVGVDLDKEAIKYAKKNYPQYKFLEADFLNKKFGEFDCIVSLDVIEHISKDVENNYFETIRKNINKNGIAVVGTPNITSEAYASAPSKAGHINLYDEDRLKTVMEKFFHNVFMFGMNDETAGTGFAPMKHYLIAVGMNKK